MPTENAARSVAISSVSQTVGRLVTAAIGLFTVAITTRYLGVEVYGQLATVTIFLSLFLILADAGFINVGVRELSRSPRQAGRILGNLLLLRSGAGVVLTLLALGAGSLLYRSANQADVRLGIVVLAGTLWLSAVQTTLTTIVQARIESYLMVIGELLNKLLVLAGVLWVVTQNAGYYGIVLAYLAGAVVWFASDAWFSLRRVRPSLQLDAGYLKQLVATTLPYAVATIVNTLYFRADGFLLSVLRDSTQVGLYSVGYKIVELTMAFPIFFAMAVLPVLSATKDRAAFAATVRRSTQVLGLVGTGVTMGVIALAPEVAKLLGGAQFAGAAWPLAVLMAGNYFIYQSMIYMQSLLASEDQSTILRINLTLLVVNVVLNLGLIPLYGSLGAAAAVVVSELLSLVLLRRFFAGHLGAPLGWRPVLKPLVPGVVMVAAILGAKDVVQGLQWPNGAVLVAGVLVGGLVYAGGVWLTGQVRLAEVRALLRPGREAA